MSHLTIDGNRYGVNLACLKFPPAEFPDPDHYDLVLDTAGGDFFVEWVNFINAPGLALALAGTLSTVTLSTFGDGGYGIGPNVSQGPRNLIPTESGSRATAIFLGGSSGVLYNKISNSGIAGIHVKGQSNLIYSNWLLRNRYEISDSVQGGQIFLDPLGRGAYVAGNVIDGGDWPDTPPPGQKVRADTGCDLPESQSYFNVGVEGYGFEHSFYNNAVLRHTGSGMQFAGSEPTGQILISSRNPKDVDNTDAAKHIENNKLGGVAFLGTDWCEIYWPDKPCRTTSGVTLDNVLIRKNSGGPSVVLDAVSDYGSYLGFVNGSCIYDNHHGNGATADWPEGTNSLTNKIPTSLNIFRGVPGACPTESEEPRPAPSNRPEWPWW